MNITPLIDVVFLLLIFFMVTTTFNQQAELRVDLPEASAEEQALEVIPIEITVDPKGLYFVNGTGLEDSEAETEDIFAVEEWAKSHPTHLRIFDQFMQHAERFADQMQLRLWHEVSVIQEGCSEMQYIGCHPKTGLLPYL